MAVLTETPHPSTSLQQAQKHNNTNDSMRSFNSSLVECGIDLNPDARVSSPPHSSHPPFKMAASIGGKGGGEGASAGAGILLSIREGKVRLLSFFFLLLRVEIPHLASLPFFQKEGDVIVVFWVRL